MGKYCLRFAPRPVLASALIALAAPLVTTPAAAQTAASPAVAVAPNGVGSAFELTFWQSVTGSEDAASYEFHNTAYRQAVEAAFVRQFDALMAAHLRSRNTIDDLQNKWMSTKARTGIAKIEIIIWANHGFPPFLRPRTASTTGPKRLYLSKLMPKSAVFSTSSIILPISCTVCFESLLNCDTHLWCQGKYIGRLDGD